MAQPRVSKPFIVLAAIGGVLLLALLGYKLLGSGGGDSTSTAASGSSSASPAAGVANAGSTTTTTVPAAPVTPNQPFDVFTTKNPFQPVIATEAPTSTPVPDTTPTTAPSGSTDTTPPTVPVDQAPSAGTAVALLEVFDDAGVVTARVQVGSTVYTVTVGATFATSYKVVSIDGSCAQFQYGDSPFQLCVGEQVLK